MQELRAWGCPSLRDPGRTPGPRTLAVSSDKAACCWGIESCPKTWRQVLGPLAVASGPQHGLNWSWPSLVQVDDKTVDDVKPVRGERSLLILEAETFRLMNNPALGPKQRSCVQPLRARGLRTFPSTDVCLSRGCFLWLNVFKGWSTWLRAVLVVVR